ncbi:MAG: DUF421 domain-containing protein [Burkholderiales bacterium]|nr:DUF421 domain-containing protein [Burkholderiales bacterium]
MFDMSLPVWEFMVRAFAVYAVLLVLVRVSGKRTVGQFTPFDLLVVMLLSEAVTESLTGGDSSLLGGLVVAGTLIALNMLLAAITARSPKADKVLQGSAVLIGQEGKLFDDVLVRERVPYEDVLRALRTEDCELDELRRAYLEADGEITILKKKPA